ncbi:MAG: DUF262 domain-containing protein [Desulfurellaceae bacterium]|nr:DUF262 domain-containing protein [Desulfurellaceae bacterium]
MAEQPDITPEEPEGLGGNDDVLSSDDNSLDTLLIRHESRTIYEIVRRIGQDAYIMDPDFQRDFIWPEKKQSKLIESVLMRIPLPVFYLAEDDQGRMVVVDGLQRLSTFKRFLDNELPLSIPGNDELNNKRFKDLPPKLQNRVEDCNLILYIMDAKIPEQARLDIFERVNSGVPLTRQQMRNSLYMGKATRFLKTEAHTEIFLRATGRSLNQGTMRDREFVNRFCAFQLRGLYTGNMDEFLAQALKKMNSLKSGDLSHLSAEFQIGLANNYEVFGRQAFRKHQSLQDKQTVLNASLWDVMSTGLSRYPEGTVKSHTQELRKAFYDLMKNSGFESAITKSTNATNVVKRRFSLAEKMFKEVLGDQPA